MTELLHSWAIAPAAIGACCLAADRGRARWPDAAASVLMLLAMLDAAVTHLVAPVYWTALLLAGAIAFAALGRQRPRSGPASRGGAGMTAHTALGMVAMAALQLGMLHSPGGAEVLSSGHGHGAGGGPGLSLLMLGGALGYATLSALLLRRSHRSLDRAQIACMGVSVSVMALGIAI